MTENEGGDLYRRLESLFEAGRYVEAAEVVTKLKVIQDFFLLRASRACNHSSYYKIVLNPICSLVVRYQCVIQNWDVS